LFDFEKLEENKPYKKAKFAAGKRVKSVLRLQTKDENLE
jgi:hypothetical protein